MIKLDRISCETEFFNFRLSKSMFLVLQVGFRDTYLIYVASNQPHREFIRTVDFIRFCTIVHQSVISIYCLLCQYNHHLLPTCNTIPHAGAGMNNLSHFVDITQ